MADATDPPQADGDAPAASSGTQPADTGDAGSWEFLPAPDPLADVPGAGTWGQAPSDGPAAWPPAPPPEASAPPTDLLPIEEMPPEPAWPAIEAPPVEPVATLRLVGGAGRVELRTDPSVEELYRASYEPGQPDVVMEPDRVTVRYALHRLFGRVRASEESRSRFALSTRLPWDIGVPDGATGLDADLASGRIVALRVGHGGGLVRLRLGRPQGTVPVVIGGGARQVIVFRPAGVMVRVATQGDVGRVIVDTGRPLGPLSGSTTVEPPGYAAAEDRYDITVAGGCEAVHVSTVPDGSEGS
ncbi:MAG: hypothetical protein KF809_03770 [Chloroflexi bacterium]|nr:hypothetical protein [Chloroflexota bacterium]